MEEFELSTRLKVGIVELITRKEFDMLLNELGEEIDIIEFSQPKRLFGKTKNNILIKLSRIH